MLKNLARWLRAAGYDTIVPDDGWSDRALMARARTECRLIVTRDRKLAEFRDARETVIVLDSITLEDHVAELTAALDLDWLYRPFTRCLLCNTLLVAADAEAMRRLRGKARILPQPVTVCPRCDKLYWAGGHPRRMRAKLETWARASRTGQAATAPPSSQTNKNL